MLISFLLTLLVIAGGAVVTWVYDEDAPLVARLCAGAVIGYTALGLFEFILASFLGLTPLTIMLATLMVASPLALLIDERRRERVGADVAKSVERISQVIARPTVGATGRALLYGLIVILLWFVFDRAMFETPDGIFTGVINNYGDLPFHLSVITSFADGNNFPPEDPTFAGARFTYPFIVDLVAAGFVRMGASLRDAMFLENIVLAVSFVGLLHRWVIVITRDRVAAIFAPLLVLFSGGLGWLRFIKDAKRSPDGIYILLSHLPAKEYTIVPESVWRWGNALSTLLVPQRSLLLGLPLALIVFTAWWASMRSREEVENEEGKSKKSKGKGKNAKATVAAERRAAKARIEETRPIASSSVPFNFLLLPSSKQLVAAGVVAGLLPLAHAHTFVVVMSIGGCIALIDFFTGGRERWRAWGAFFIVALIVAGPQLWWATHGTSVKSGSFIGWQFGWDKGQENVFVFWLKNTGMFIPLLFAAMLWRGRRPLVSRRLLLYYLPFTLCFIVPNLIRLAPWVWDNIKVLFYWYMASVPLVALLLARLWREGKVARAVAVLLLLTMTLAGALDVWRIASRAVEYGVFDRAGVEFARMTERNTQPRSMILHAPVHNAPVYLTGRRSLMGYPGHIWTHGIEFVPREADIRRIYAGGSDAPGLLAKYGVEYVVVGPLERNAVRVNEQFFSRYLLVGEIGEYRLFKITQ